MVEYEKQLEIQKAKEDAARLAAIKEQEKEDTSTVVYVPTDSDQYLLGLQSFQCEAGGESYDGKLAVRKRCDKPCEEFVFSELCLGCDLPERSVLAGGERQTGVSSGSGCGRKLPSGGAGCAKRQYYGGLPVFQTE